MNDLLSTLRYCLSKDLISEVRLHKNPFEFYFSDDCLEMNIGC